jgi:DNA (cytosine-5)-methyltransferase 1
VEPSGGEPVIPIKASRDLYNEGIGPGPVNGFWSDADWLFCRDDKWRPVEPGTFPLADGTAARVGRLRANWDTPAGKEGFGHRTGRLKGYGNAINAEAATIFIQSVMELLNSSASREFAA